MSFLIPYGGGRLREEHDRGCLQVISPQLCGDCRRPSQSAWRRPGRWRWRLQPAGQARPCPGQWGQGPAAPPRGWRAPPPVHRQRLSRQRALRQACSATMTRVGSGRPMAGVWLAAWRIRACQRGLVGDTHHTLCTCCHVALDHLLVSLPACLPPSACRRGGCCRGRRRRLQAAQQAG